MPHYRFERKIEGPVAGVDEAGRGPWAGPVVVAAVILNPAKIPRGINDSKQVAPEIREKLFDKIMASALAVKAIVSEVDEIDRINIYWATMNAMSQAVRELTLAPVHVLVDGNRVPEMPCPVRAIVDGDTKSLSIAAASIIAKVTRDRIMCEMANTHPVYGFERHKGYGTPEHADMLLKHGPCTEHRRSFAPVRVAMEALNGGNASPETLVNFLNQQDS
jgi:ribonuclease HII